MFASSPRSCPATRVTSPLYEAPVRAAGAGADARMVLRVPRRGERAAARLVALLVLAAWAAARSRSPWSSAGGRTSPETSPERHRARICREPGLA
ncbi:hypothetical protein HBB16_13095 [Pseudonocardia sp. MCCB 268]|nr:hypothetical protein [Pseudonocardia cytotoxica]